MLPFNLAASIPESTVDVFATNGIPAMIAGSFAIGSLIGLCIALRKGSVLLTGFSVLILIASVLTASVNGVYASVNTSNNELLLVSQQAHQTRTAEDTQVATDLEERYGFPVTTDLVGHLFNGEVTFSDYQAGRGDGIVWRGEPVEYVINDTIYILQLAWVGEEWVLADVTAGETTQILELDLTAQEG